MCKISIAMAAYNEKVEYLDAAVRSILTQTYEDFEFIIVLDNPNNIVLKEKLLSYELEDKRIHVIINETNIGLAMSLNKAMGIAKGDYIARMDADDVAMPERLERQLAFMEEHPEIDILSINKILIDEKGDVLAKGGALPTNCKQIGKVLQYGNIIVHPGVLMRSTSIKKVGGYRDFPVTQDLDLWLRVIDAGMTIAILDEYLMYYRINSQSVSFAKAYRQTVIEKYILELSAERKKSGTDSFSKENLLLYLDKYWVNDESRNKRFQEARSTFEEARIALKNKQIVKGIWCMILAMKDPFMRWQIKRIVICSIMKSRVGEKIFG